MTWKEFKEKAEELGVTDEMNVLYIDVDDQEELFVQHPPDMQSFSIE